jgi:hypothetical protein
MSNAYYMNDANLPDCFTFCEEFEPGFLGVLLERETLNTPADGLCICYSTVGTPQPAGLASQGGITLMTMTYCGAGPPAPALPCCAPFTGDLSLACADPTSAGYGDGKCLPNEWQVSFILLLVSFNIKKIDCKHGFNSAEFVAKAPSNGLDLSQCNS